MTKAWLKSIVRQSPLPSDPESLSDLVAFAEAHHVLGQMATVWQNEATGKLKDVFENAAIRTAFDHRMLAFEMGRIERALHGTGIAPVLLKGGAYVALELPASEGRRVADIDILVAEDDLEQTENRLKEAGWAFEETTDNEYDQAYYREFMHELPPLRHIRRRTVVDVHHRILPRTSRVLVKNDMLIDAAQHLKGRELRTFQPVDLFIHSSVHSFADGSFDTPARSLVELYFLFSGLSEADKSALAERSVTVGASMPVATALWALNEFFGEKVPGVGADSMIKPASALVRGAFRAKLENISGAYFAKLILYVRSHYLRMPIPQLALHLMRKAARQLVNAVKREDPLKSQ
ncbi:MAG: hypothetical protein COB37_05870 [Kordiimonadales bacterium]|nr:MAG: hypothetical protein COB37_05870 [Kordiimonadales bacterium]